MEQQEMDEKQKYAPLLLTHEEKKTLAYNMNIIQALWKSINKGDFGENKVRGNEYDVNSLYGSLEKSRQTIRDIINMEKDFEKNKISAWATRIEKKTGIPYAYLTGAERIKLGYLFEEKYYPVYEEYISDCTIINDYLIEAEQNQINWSCAKIKKFVNKKGKEKTKEKFKALIEEAEKAIKLNERFEKALKNEIDKVKEISSVRGLREDIKRYRLIYFIKFKKKYGANHIEKIQDIMRVFDDIHTVQLKELGAAGLEMYIDALKKQLKLAEAVYTVAIDCGNFKI